MLPKYSYWLLALAAILLSRFVGMAIFPFADTTEPRYAEIARLMVETGDWITPWFEPGVPFWGKPPLSFWSQAAAIKLFGLSEFALRLPSWLATIGMVYLTWRLALQLWGSHVARWSALIFSSMALTYVSAGAVMTDAFLALGTTLSLVSFCLATQEQGFAWRWLFFLGLAIGLLAKGPLAAVLVGIPIVLWLLFRGGKLSDLKALPWLRGGLITAVLVLPWYVGGTPDPGISGLFPRRRALPPVCRARLGGGSLWPCASISAGHHLGFLAHGQLPVGDTGPVYAHCCHGEKAIGDKTQFE